MEIHAGGTRASIRFHHPTGNIITAEIVARLRTDLAALRAHPEVKLVTLEGEGTDFSFGASIPEHAPDRIGEVLPEMHRLILDLLDAPAPTAAVVRGRCLGGGFELALACDFVLASSDASFGLPEIKLGVFPPAAAALLPWCVGASRAADAVLTGEPSSAADWHAAGVVNWVAPPDRLEADVDRWFADRFAPKSAAALRHAAAAIRRTRVAHVRDVLPDLERLYLEGLMQTDDAVEGVSAFLEKRPPVWRNR